MIDIHRLDSINRIVPKVDQNATAAKPEKTLNGNSQPGPVTSQQGRAESPNDGLKHLSWHEKDSEKTSRHLNLLIWNSPNAINNIESTTFWGMVEIPPISPLNQLGVRRSWLAASNFNLSWLNFALHPSEEKIREDPKNYIRGR